MKPSAEFAVVIPTHNGRGSVERAVRSVLAQTHSDFELVVVSDGEGARTRALLADVHDTRLRIVEQPKAGVSAARNLGAASTGAEWLTFLDDDDSVRPDWLASWASEIRPDVGAITGRLAFWTNGRQTHLRTSHLRPEDPTMNASAILPGGFAMRRSLFDAVGGFDEGLTYSENQDLGLRVCDYLTVHPDMRVVNTDRVVADFQREGATTRWRRYRSAPAISARVFQQRYATRLRHDRTTSAALHRIMARSNRVEGQPGAAVRHAAQAVRLQPARWENIRALLIALGDATVRLPLVRFRAAAQMWLPRRGRSEQ